MAVPVGGEDKEAISQTSVVGKVVSEKAGEVRPKTILAHDQVSSSMCMYYRSDSSYLVSQPLPNYHFGAF